MSTEAARHCEAKSDRAAKVNVDFMMKVVMDEAKEYKQEKFVKDQVVIFGLFLSCEIAEIQRQSIRLGSSLLIPEVCLS